MKKNFCILLLAMAAIAIQTNGKVRLPAVVGDNMVLQQQCAANLWGWTDPGKTVTVTPSWDQKNYSATADNKGNWMVKVNTPKAGGPYTITVSDGEPLTIENVLVGEVWVCSGQSNMEMPVKGYPGQPTDQGLISILESGKYSNKIRFITAPRRPSDKPETDMEAQWMIASPATTPECSATAYFFAKNLTDILGVPVGIITSSWGGSRIEPWMDMKTASTIEGLDMATRTDPSRPANQRIAQLYNGLIWPIKNFTAKGFLWYQGESNRSNYQQYPALMTAMVNLWRQIWNAPEMPFYYVQIAPYRNEGRNDISGPLLIEAQLKALKMIPHSGMIPTTDIGNEFCIHPAQKDIVGLRLANLALVDTYGFTSVPATGPIMKEVKFEKGKAIVTFDYAPNGLSPINRPIEGFELAGADKVFYPATGKVSKSRNSVEVSCKEVPEPVAVRYAFRNYMDGLTLENNYSFPAFPFRSDTWDDVK